MYCKVKRSKPAGVEGMILLQSIAMYLTMRSPLSYSERQYSRYFGSSVVFREMFTQQPTNAKSS